MSTTGVVVTLVRSSTNLFFWKVMVSARAVSNLSHLQALLRKMKFHATVTYTETDCGILGAEHAVRLDGESDRRWMTKLELPHTYALILEEESKQVLLNSERPAVRQVVPAGYETNQMSYSIIIDIVSKAPQNPERFQCHSSSIIAPVPGKPFASEASTLIEGKYAPPSAVGLHSRPIAHLDIFNPKVSPPPPPSHKSNTRAHPSPTHHHYSTVTSNLTLNNSLLMALQYLALHS